ncbi:MAG TPA: YihY/virulence factor BrkB family protein [Cytophagales bacterium]|nr:YihY/virulence factor BrkB family protein [Cytophagales bacterium]HAA21003.1 YihY/virulence factor BrkB family protein [Cytophagales bacterium]HAP61535.1 YihY/virulence factor BrkB family protein [Cytophagales bacterium]
MKNRLVRYITHHRRYHQLIEWLKGRRINRRQASLYSVLLVLIGKIRKDELVDRGNAVAFNFTLSVFPLLIFIFTLIPFISAQIPGLEVNIMGFLEEVVPPDIWGQVAPTIQDIVSNQRSNLLSFGFLSAIYFAGSGILSLMRAFNAIYRTKEKRSYLRTRGVATVITFLLAGVLFVAIILIIVGQVVLDWLDNQNLLHDLLDGRITVWGIVALRFVVVFLIFQVAISFIYYLAPSIKERWHFFNWGSVFASLACIAVSFGFAYYVSSFGTYNRLYGSIGTLIALMIWFYLLGMILLIGFEINASIDKASRKDFDPKSNPAIG